MSIIEKIASWDTELFLFINGLHNEFFDGIMFWTSHRFFWIPLYALLLFLLVRKEGWKSIIIIVPAIAILILITDQGSVFIKNWVGRYRPCHNGHISDMVHLVNGYCGGQFGFVSSHAANSFALAVFAGKLLRDRYRHMMTILLIWAVVVAYSRIYLGVHYPADIVAGALFGAAIAHVIVKSYAYFSNRTGLVKPK